MSVDGWIGSQESPKGGIDWSKVRELLRVGQYERVSKILHEAKVAQEEIEGAIPSHVLAVAFRICLACRQCQEEVEWHRGAHQEALQRESELKQQLYNILDLISESGVSMSPGGQEGSHSAHAVEMTLSEDYLSEHRERQSLWQRIKALLGWGIDSRTHEGHTLSSSVEVGSTLPTENVEGIADRSPVEEEAPTGRLADDIDELASDLPEAPAPPLSVAEHQGTTTSQIEKKKQGAQNAPLLVVYCLGSFQAFLHSQIIEDWSSLKSQAIFKFLIHQPQAQVHREQLMEIFWPDTDPESARRNLHQAIYSLRQILKDNGADLQVVQFVNECYRINPELVFWLDSAEFQRHVKAGQRHDRDRSNDRAIAEYSIAEGLYQGHFLADDPYLEWTMLTREHLWQLYMACTQRLMSYYWGRKEYAGMAALCQRVLAMDRAQELAHTYLIRGFLAQGQRELALRQYEQCVDALRAELDIEPSAELKALYRQIHRT